MSKFSINNLRLFVKVCVTAWVPIGVLLGVIPWSTEVATAVMAATIITIDSAFRVFGVGEDDGLLGRVQHRRTPRTVK